MSHFATIVITDEKPANDTLEKILQPWHEYECTGVKDEHVVWVDHTEEVERQWRGEERGEHWDDDFVPSERYDGIEAFTEDWHGYKIEDGKIGRWTNPNAKWDWWVVGGRWTGTLTPHDTSAADRGTPSWINADEEIDGFDICQVGNLTNLDELSAFAVVKDGQWYERGSMGWWGIVSDEKPGDEWDAKLKELLAGLPPETWIAVVDCHI